MKIGLPLVLAISVLVAGVTGCDTRIEDSPIEVAEAQAIRSIEAAGGDPADWKLDAECVAQGPCQVAMSAAAAPGAVVATDRYTVKDTRATVNGPENIEAAVRQAATGESRP